MKQTTAYRTILSAIIMATLLASPVKAQTVLVSDGFEEGIGNWTVNNNSYLYTGSLATTGTDAVAIPRNYNSADYTIDNMTLSTPLQLDSHGFTNITISFDFKWSTAAYGAVTLTQYSSDGGSTWVDIGSFSYSASGSQSYTIAENAPNSFTDNAFFRIANYAQGSGYRVIDNVLITGLPEYDGTAPAIDTLSPTNTEVLLTPAFLQITFTEDVFTNAAGSITVTNITDSSSDTMEASELSISGDTLTITPDPVLEGSRTYAVLVATNAIKDGADNFFAGLTDTNGWQFTTIGDTQSPGVATLSPANGASNISLSTSLIATFDEVVVTNTGGTFAITNVTDGTVYVFSGAEIEVASSNITLNPTLNLLSGKTYAVVISTNAVKDPFGNFFAGYTSTNDWQFRTDGTPPALLTVSPANGSQNIAPSSGLVATFTEAIQAGSGNIVISNITDSSVMTIAANDTSQITFSGTTLTIDPYAWLDFGKAYAVIIENDAVQDQAGLNFEGTDSADWGFSTKEAGYSILDNDPLVPAGLVAGETFHFAFVTSTEINWSGVTDAANVFDWDDYVNTRAGVSSVSAVPDITWFAIVSTPSTNARDHAVIQGPVYLLNGTQIAVDYTDMWNGDILATLSQTENDSAVGGSVRVWTGTNNDGTRENGNELGAADTAGVQGARSATGTGNPGWIRGSTWFNTIGSTAGHVYALSEPIRVQLVPLGSVFRFR